MKHFSTFLLFVPILALMPTQALFAQSATITLNADTSCVTYNDPKDPNVPAGKDVRKLEITIQGDEVQVRMAAYADWDFFFSNLGMVQCWVTLIYTREPLRTTKTVIYDKWRYFNVLPGVTLI